MCGGMAEGDGRAGANSVVRDRLRLKLMSQLQAQVPDPLTDDLPCLLPPGLTGIGFLSNSFLSACPCLRATFLRASPLLFPPPLLLVHLAELGLFPGWGDGFGPLARPQNPHGKRLGLKQQGQQHQPPAHDTTQAANGQLTRRSLALRRAICRLGNDAPGSCCWHTCSWRSSA